jgi:hypothetical protein
MRTPDPRSYVASRHCRRRNWEMSENVISDECGRELAHRVAEGIEVQLFWRASDDTVTVVVHEVLTAVRFELRVEPDQALNAFHHPCAYAAAVRCVGDGRSAVAS